MASARHGGVTVSYGDAGEPRTFARDVGFSPAAPAPGVSRGSWIVWLVLAALLGVAEVVTATLAFGLLAVAAVVAAIVGAVGLGLPVQLAAFAVTAGAGLGVVRPLAVRHIRQPPLPRAGASALGGRAPLVIEGVTGPSGAGRSRGWVWAGRSSRV